MLTCLSNFDQYGNPVYAKVGMQLYYANCSRSNPLCNPKSSAYLPAITVCNVAYGYVRGNQVTNDEDQEEDE